MKQTRKDLTDFFRAKQAKDSARFEVIDNDELICTYKTKTLKKIVFFTCTLDRTLYSKFAKIKNEHQADRMIVYCEFAYIASPGTLEIVLNRRLPTP